MNGPLLANWPVLQRAICGLAHSPYGEDAELRKLRSIFSWQAIIPKFFEAVERELRGPPDRIGDKSTCGCRGEKRRQLLDLMNKDGDNPQQSKTLRSDTSWPEVW